MNVILRDSENDRIRSYLPTWTLALAIINLPAAIAIQQVLELPYSRMPFPEGLLFATFSLAVFVLAVLGFWSAFKRTERREMFISVAAACLAGIELWCTFFYAGYRAAY